jgi:hypothetical protein
MFVWRVQRRATWNLEEDTMTFMLELFVYICCVINGGIDTW